MIWNGALSLRSCVAFGKTFILLSLSFLIYKMRIIIPFMCLKHPAHSRWSGNSGCIFAPSHNIIAIHHHWRRQFGVLIWCPEDRSRAYTGRSLSGQGQGEQGGGVGVKYSVTFVNSHISNLALRAAFTTPGTEQTVDPQTWKEQRSD